MVVYLFNSSMMPVEGTYELKRISKQKFIELCNLYYKQNCLSSYIGYETTQKHIEQIADIPVKLNRNQLYDLQPGDIMLICKLRYRLISPDFKSNKQFQKEINDNDFEYFLCNYGTNDNK